MATPEQEEQVRRALAAAARAEREEHGRLPDDVAHRLDDVLADLVAQRSAPASPPDELAERRRRRWPRVLAAAATVAVVVVLGGTVALRGLQGSGGSADSGAAGSSSAEQAVPSAPQSDGRQALAGGAGTAPELHTATLRRDVQGVVDAGVVSDRVQAAVPSPAASSSAKAAETCPAPALPAGAEAVDVRLDGEPAVLVLGRAHDGTRAARVYSCGDTRTPVASTRVRAR